ncbi:DUF721 domain-containing protein [Eikenella sp. S3360]|uniref:DUF721 domain-containing protein n=1 Tax=Eikenella glucosivorans TaxID=2766967 RepID=A0ABS0NCB1_9NEIS|nr:DciA family protein [Eikenella glucosivorans]MBH5329955.1 DUF721 domain-containing protein [Eikenella glucosivorans]
MSELDRLDPGRHSLHSREQMSRGDLALHDLIVQAEGWRHTAEALEANLPAKLRRYCRAVRLRDGVLVWYADNNMAAARLRMLSPGLLPAWRSVCPEAREVLVKISPREPEREKVKQAHLSRAAAEKCREMAEGLARHPELAAALRRLARHADEGEGGA